jgi:hypothetical protein
MGLFTAGQKTGVFVVVATCVCGFADTATVQIGNAPAQLSRLIISPKAATVQQGALQEFTVSARWSTGDTAVPPVTFQAVGGGEMSNAGVFRAPARPGTYRVIVAHQGGTMRDTAIVTVPAVIGADPEVPPVQPPSGGGAEPFFADDFEASKLRSENGFRWIGSGSVTLSTENAVSGNRALLFRYGPKQNWVEQRFNMGRYVSELWIEYMLFVPSNYKHRSGTTSQGKFLQIWRDNYSGEHTWHVGIEYWRVSDRTSRARYMARTPVHRFNTSTGPTPYPLLIGEGAPLQPGQWSRVRFHVKAASTRESSDGIMEMWVNDKKIFGFYEGDFHNGPATFEDASLRNGYLMGWHNSGFAETTDFFIDDIKFYDQRPGW